MNKHPTDQTVTLSIGGAFDAESAQTQPRRHWGFCYTPASNHLSLRVSPDPQRPLDDPGTLEAAIDAESLAELIRWLGNVQRQIEENR